MIMSNSRWRQEAFDQDVDESLESSTLAVPRGWAWALPEGRCLSQGFSTRYLLLPEAPEAAPTEAKRRAPAALLPQDLRPVPAAQGYPRGCGEWVGAAGWGQGSGCYREVSQVQELVHKAAGWRTGPGMLCMYVGGGELSVGAGPRGWARVSPTWGDARMLWP